MKFTGSTFEVFVNNTNLTFLYKIDIKGFKKVSKFGSLMLIQLCQPDMW